MPVRPWFSLFHLNTVIFMLYIRALLTVVCMHMGVIKHSAPKHRYNVRFRESLLVCIVCVPCLLIKYTVRIACIKYTEQTLMDHMNHASRYASTVPTYLQPARHSLVCPLRPCHQRANLPYGEPLHPLKVVHRMPLRPSTIRGWTIPPNQGGSP